VIAASPPVFLFSNFEEQGSWLYPHASPCDIDASFQKRDYYRLGMNQILAPILLLVLIGLFLAHLRFLGRDFMSDLNKLVFWVALPALLFRSVAHAERPGSSTFALLGLLVIGTLLMAAGGWISAGILSMPHASKGTLSQSAFRGNLAYIGIPVLVYAFQGLPGKQEAFSTAIITMAFLTAFCNALAVVILSIGEKAQNPLRTLLRSIFTNPLILAGMAGMPLAFTGSQIPVILDRTLDSLGSAAVPISLLCIGGSLAQAKLGDRFEGILVAALLKNLCFPLLVYLLSPLFGIAGNNLTIALVLAACPTAAASFVTVQQMGGDEPLAGRSIVLSTICAAASLPLALYLSR
jgi:predicted permease